MTRRDRSSDRLLMRSDQLELVDRSLEQQAIEQEHDDVDDARRAEYLERLRAALPELRKIEGFPIGTDEDILALSDPPYYTACPNPFLGEFVAEHGTPYDEATDDYHREPFAADVSEGKNDPIYNAHSYHTKVPHKAIMRYILHYTKPGDIVFDGFCGTGMTGVAAQLCGSPDPDFKVKVEAEWAAAGHQKPEWGARKAILGDLSPAATFIAYNLNRLGETGGAWAALSDFSTERSRLADAELSTANTGKARSTRAGALRSQDGVVQYVVWSDVVRCGNCGTETPWWQVVYRGRGEETDQEPACPQCSARFPRVAERVWESLWDRELEEQVRQAKTVPVLINYADGTTRFEKAPDEEDFAAAAAADSGRLTVPLVALPPGFNTAQPIRSHGYTHVHHFFTRRNLTYLAEMWAFADRLDARQRAFAFFALTSLIQRVFRLNRYMPKHDRHVGPLSGTLYVSAITAEIPVVHYLRDKLKDLSLSRYRLHAANVAITTGSSTGLPTLPTHSVDYIFTDPPFGGNLNYSELNILSEAWLGVLTANGSEAIINDTQGKGLPEYQRLMTQCFEECHRILKPRRWITVEFHNSQNSVWTSIQEALAQAGFVVADVRILDKQKGTTKQLSYTNTVKSDLVISAYKTDASLDRIAPTESPQTMWHFVEQHLGMLPVADRGRVTASPILERDPAVIFDRVVAFFVTRGTALPLSAPAFYRELRARYPLRGGMVFLPVQAAEWDAQWIASKELEPEQLPTFIADEQAAIRYLRLRLTKPATYQDIFPDYTARLHPGVALDVPELQLLLEESFVRDTSGQWRLPDPTSEKDLVEIRQRALLGTYGEYVRSRGKLTRVRADVLAAGFGDAWSERRYDEIIEVAERLPDSVIQEDVRLLMYYDNALLRRG